MNFSVCWQSWQNFLCDGIYSNQYGIYNFFLNVFEVNKFLKYIIKTSIYSVLKFFILRTDYKNNIIYLIFLNILIIIIIFPLTSKKIVYTNIINNNLLVLQLPMLPALFRKSVIITKRQLGSDFTGFIFYLFVLFNCISHTWAVGPQIFLITTFPRKLIFRD